MDHGMDQDMGYDHGRSWTTIWVMSMGQGMHFGQCVGWNQDQDGDQNMADMDDDVDWDAIQNTNRDMEQDVGCLGYASGYGVGWELC